MNSSVEPQTRWAALQHLLGRGLLWGLGAGAVSALLGLLLTGHGRAGALTGLNVAGIGLGALAGLLLLWGAFITTGAEAYERSRLGQAAPGIQFPLVPTLVALIAAGVCFGLAWVGGLWLRGG